MASNGKELTLYVVKSYDFPLLAIIKETGEKIFAIRSCSMTTSKHFTQMGYGRRVDVFNAALVNSTKGNVRAVDAIGDDSGYFLRFSSVFADIVNEAGAVLEAEELAKEVDNAKGEQKRVVRL